MSENDIIFSPLQQELYAYLKKHGRTDRQELVEHFNSPRTTIYDNLMGLIQCKLVKKYAIPTNDRGRPRIYFTINEATK